MGDDGSWILWAVIPAGALLLVVIEIERRRKARAQLGSVGGADPVIAAWRRMAHAVGGTPLWPTQSPNQRTIDPIVPYGAEVPVGRATVTVTSSGPPIANSPSPFSPCLRAHCTAPPWLKLTISRRHQDLGGHPRVDELPTSLPVGDPGFDQAFRIGANVPDLAWAMIDEEVLSRLARAAKYELVVRDGTVEATAEDPDLDLAALRHAIQAVAIVGQAFDQLSRQWAQAVSKVFGRGPSDMGPVDDDFTTLLRLAALGDGPAVEVSAWTSFAGSPPIWLHTRISTHMSSPLKENRLVVARRAGVVETDWGDEASSRPAGRPDWADSLAEVELGNDPVGRAFEVRSEDPATTRERLTPDLCDGLMRAGPELLTAVGDRLETSLPGLVIDADRLRAGVELLEIAKTDVKSRLYR